MRTPYATFKDWFKAGGKLIEAGNQHQRVYVNASDTAALDLEERKKALLSDPEGVVLLSYGKNFSLVHSFKQLGDTLHRLEDKILCLLGMEDQACPFEFSVKPAMEGIDMMAPPIEEILACESIAELKALDIPENTITRNNRHEYVISSSSVLFLPPWALASILEFEMSDSEDLSLELLLHLKEAREAYDQKHEIDEDPSESQTWMAFATKWLFLNNIGTIDKAILTCAINDPEARDFSSQRHSQCINKPITANGTLGNPTGGVETFAQLSNEISKFTESNARSNALRVKEIERSEESEKNKKNRIEKWITLGNKQMILNLMSDDGITAATDFTDELKTFMNAESLGQAGRILQWQLSQLNLNNTHISETALRQMFHGEIFSTIPGVPKGLTSFAFSESTSLQADQSEEFTMLHIADTTCTTKSIDDIKTAHSKSLIKVQSNFYELMESFDRVSACLKMYLGPLSLPYIKFKVFTSKVKEHKSQLIQMSLSDPQIFAKVAYQQELFFQQFARECSLCENREDVDMQFLDYSNINFEISVGRFNANLPGIFKTFSPKPPIAPKPSVETEEQDPNKHKDKKRKVENPSQYAPFKLHENENFHNTFTGRDKVSTCPCFINKPMCRRWNILGHCYNTCNMIESHVPEDKLSQQQKSEFGAWMASCRQASGSA